MFSLQSAFDIRPQLVQQHEIRHIPLLVLLMDAQIPASSAHVLFTVMSRKPVFGRAVHLFGSSLILFVGLLLA